MPACGASPRATASCSRASPSDAVSANRTAFAKVFSGHVGIDPYTTAVSDVYQDLFHEGSYVGKGIYDVDAFEAALAGRVPENALLSHDLFEGLYARAALCTDIHLVDDYPSHYLAFAARQHRWVRGDWQIMRWLWRTVPDAARHPVPNTLPVIARWKILDNLRRSLLPIALVALLVAGWTILPGSAAAVDSDGAAGARLSRIHPGRRVRSRAACAGCRVRDTSRAERDNARHERAPGRSVGGDSGPPGLSDGRRDRPHAVATARQRATTPRVGVGVSGGDE